MAEFVFGWVGTAEALHCQPEVGCEVVLLDWDWNVAEARCCQL